MSHEGLFAQNDFERYLKWLVVFMDNWEFVGCFFFMSNPEADV